ncbi:hypothetical protein PsorP6_015694 [Peronosclerospora sorghi]|uniref:Uncharacterized protein n=1 Tax=Peronosclerospora sorghi TaxID=230839 RepID=A0ACC0WNU8_9STRA|nr:hypothetical protein PsorP6_015694 [Peronosclerospora sorghi]
MSSTLNVDSQNCIRSLQLKLPLAKKFFSLQTASAVADLSPSAVEAHLAAHGLTSKQMYDHIFELEETLQADRNERDKYSCT